MARARDPRAEEAYKLHDNGRGLPIHRVAERLGAPVPTVKSWIRRIRKERQEKRLGRAADARPDADAKVFPPPAGDAHLEWRIPSAPEGVKPRQSHGDRPTCGAHAKQSGQPCRLPAGFGTDHVGTGRCKFHGGCAGAPKGNKNGVITGQYETILRDALADEERADFDAALASEDRKAWLKEQIALCRIRIKRMQKRLRYYHEQEAASKDGLEHYGTDLGEDTGNEHRDGVEEGKDTSLQVLKQSKSVTIRQRKWADRILRTELALNQTQKLLKDLVAELDALENPGKKGGVNVQVGITWIEQARAAAASRMLPIVTTDSRRF